MCAIAGIISLNTQLVAANKLQLMANVLLHRGSNGNGIWVNENNTVGLAHQRLSIIDLSENAAQPMHFTGKNNQHYTIILNGEIYNYLELKEELKKKNYTFKTNSDTEVLLALYDCYQEKCLQYLDGMFAFAIWHKEVNKLFIARDRFGEKPFYYYHDKEQFVFASEMKALWTIGIKKEINPSLLLGYLSAGFVSNPANKAETFYAQINKLPAAHALIFNVHKNDLFIYPYWQLNIQPQKNNTHSFNELTEQFSVLLQQSVNRRLRSDVAIGTSLSGGLDSSSIVATIHTIAKEKNLTQPKTFSAVFPNFEKDESAYIQQVTDKFNLQNYTVTPTAEDFAEDFEKLLYHQEEPFQSSSIYVQYKVYALAKKHGVTVLLDGQGADETLAGYTKYYHWYWQELLNNFKLSQLYKEMNAVNNHQQIDWGLKNFAAAFFPTFAAKKLSLLLKKQIIQHPFLHQDFIQSAFNKSITDKPTIKQLNDILYYNTFTHGLEDLLRYADRNSMAHGIEVRLPYLQHDLVSFIFNLPSSYKIKEGFTKYILRKSVQNLLPENIVWRKDKIGFEPPQQKWMNHQSIIEQTQIAKQKLVAKGIADKSLLNMPLQNNAAHTANNYQWWILCAGNLL